jgi:glycosyl transferase, family 25
VTLPIRVINLERSVDRKREFIQNNAGLAHEFFPAVDGKLLTERQIGDERLFIKPLPFPSIGAYGVALSHLALWERVIEANQPMTIAEDDAIFRSDFASESGKVLSQLPESWDIILWGWNFDSILCVTAIANVSPVVMLFNQNSLREQTDSFRKLTLPSHLLKLDKCFGIPAYTISPAGAKKFKAQCFPMKNFELYFPILNRKIPNTGIDVAMNRIYSSTESFVAFPPLAITKNDHGVSTIQKK